VATKLPKAQRREEKATTEASKNNKKREEIGKIPISPNKLIIKG